MRARIHQENQTLYKDLAILLAVSGLGGCGFAIDLIALREVFPKAPDIAYYKGFTEVLSAMRRCAAYNKQTVKFTFDRRPESNYNSVELYRMYSEMPEWTHIVFPEISFAYSRTSHRLQPADLFAREAMKALDNRVGPTKRPMRKSWATLHDTGRFHIDAISIDWFKDLERQMPELERESEMSGGRYSEWLGEHKLQHNITNMFRFMESTDKKGK